MKPPARTRRKGLAQCFTAPVLIALASIAGLVIGLTGEGARDWLSWLLLSLPLAALAWAFLRRA